MKNGDNLYSALTAQCAKSSFELDGDGGRGGGGCGDGDDGDDEYDDDDDDEFIQKVLKSTTVRKAPTPSDIQRL